ncbi:tetratricopeptide repeat protein [Sandaracinus amylolyticus]|uniref:tetratricopeptide repeat protein n=1 Tax=Sandaracinus amylolyticus TaxID=927083 RepID=UPI001F1D6679|nr:hypothetical protein [Sandaracinus amylolyticus]UJR84633.1 Hypothetical protein I5071_67120 [Sandaracinus amylolyticus]
MASVRHEIALARRALEQGDPQHAAHHAAAAIALDPLDPGALALVDHLNALPAPGLGAAIARFFGKRDGDPAPLFAKDGFAGDVAARARASWVSGDLAGAFPRAVDLAAQVPDRPFVAWAIEIARAAAQRRIALDVAPYFSAYADLGASTMGLLHLRPTERRFFAPWGELGEILIACQSPDDDRTALLRMATSALLRRAGEYERALAVMAPVSAETSAHLLTARGFALRALGRWDEAARVFEASMRAPGGRVENAYEVGRTWWDAGRPDDARAWFERAASPTREEAIALEVLAERIDPSAPRRWSKVLGERTSYDAVRRLALGHALAAPMGDASTNVLASLREAPPMTLKTTTTCVEAPSAILTLALRALGTADARGLAYSASRVPTPHPFEPLDRTLGASLWSAEGVRPIQALGAPSAAISAMIDGAVRALWARMRDDAPPLLGIGEAWRVALGTPDLDGIEPSELIAAMIHPTAPASWSDVVPWVFDRQVVAALMLGAQDRHRPWLASRRRESLRALVLGPADWTRAAALVALREVLLDEPDALEDARGWCERLLESQPDHGHVAWAEALRSLLLVPGMPARDVARIVGLPGDDQDERER